MSRTSLAVSWNLKCHAFSTGRYCELHAEHGGIKQVRPVSVPQFTLRAHRPFQVEIRLIPLNAPMRVSFVTLVSGLAALTLVNALPPASVPAEGVGVPHTVSLPTRDDCTVSLARALLSMARRHQRSL